MGDRPGSSSRVRTSEDKVRRKDLCWSMRAVYILEKLPDVSGPDLGEAGRYSRAAPVVDKEDGAPRRGKQKTQRGDEPLGEKHLEGPTRKRSCRVQRSSLGIPEGGPIRIAGGCV